MDDAHFSTRLKLANSVKEVIVTKIRVTVDNLREGDLSGFSSVSARASSLLFLVPYLLFWENVASISTCAERDATIQHSLEKLLTLTTFMSHVMSIETAKLFTEFVSTPLIHDFFLKWPFMVLIGM